jgi:uncharacterized membrane protein YhaH (DUF805 family)
MTDFRSLLFGFNGRLNRTRFWAAGFVVISLGLAFGFLLLLVAKMLGTGAVSFQFDGQDLFRLFDPVFAVAMIDRLRAADLNAPATLLPLLYRVIVTPVVLWCCAAITAKRLHDRNRSGWWLIPFLAVPGFYDQFESRVGTSMFAGVISFVVSVLGIWAFVELIILKGTTGPNRFGPDPLVEVDTRPAWDQQSEVEFVPHRAGPSPEAHGKREA